MNLPDQNIPPVRRYPWLISSCVAVAWLVLAGGGGYLGATVTGAQAFHMTGGLVGIVGAACHAAAFRTRRFSRLARWQQAVLLALLTTCMVALFAFILISARGGSVKDAVFTSLFVFMAAGLLATVIAFVVAYASRAAALCTRSRKRALPASASG